jgi:S1-C subfamily serine protease
VLLTINGTSASGPHALRAFLGADKIGTAVEVRFLRDAALLTAQLVVAMQPG